MRLFGCRGRDHRPGPVSLSNLTLLPLALFLSLLPSQAAAIKCHSCLTHCKTVTTGKVDAEKCDCLSKEREMCEGNACFAKIELFPEEKTAILQKGCITDIPGGMEGCQYASNSETIHCFCSTPSCNNRRELNNFSTGLLPSVECCACSEKLGEHCNRDECPRKCTGNYCVVDFDGLEQGCGLGFPRLQSFLRMEKYTKWQGKPICARYEATPSTVMNGCTCTNPSGACNEFNRTRAFQVEKVIERRPEAQQYCYSLAHKNVKQFGQEVFKKSTTCEGQYCFISYTTSEIVLESADFEHNYDDHEEFVGQSRPRYEILAGCLKVDDDEKISLGCTVEYSQNASEPLSKHCICESHLCNFYHLLTESPDPRPRTILAAPQSSPSNSRAFSSSALPATTATSSGSNAVPVDLVVVTPKEVASDALAVTTSCSLIVLLFRLV